MYVCMYVCINALNQHSTITCIYISLTCNEVVKYGERSMQGKRRPSVSDKRSLQMTPTKYKTWSKNIMVVSV